MGQPCKVQVLIIEDENTLTAIDQLKMQSSACDIKVVKQGEEAENELLSNKYDLILVDWNVMKERSKQQS